MPKLNFFTPFLEQKEKTRILSKKLIVFLVLLLAGGAYLALQLQVHMLQESIAQKEQQLEQIKTSQLVEIMETKRKITEQKTYFKMANSLEQEFEKADFIKVALIEKILDTVPQNLFFQNLSLNSENWQILGYAETRPTIAEFQYNLKESGFIDGIKISSINNKPVENKGDYYAFSMAGTFKEEVANDEN